LTEKEYKNWKKSILIVDATLEDAIKNLDKTSIQIILVTTQGGDFIGTITDGDIRRGLLRGMDLNSPIEPIVNKEPFVVPPDMHRDTVIQLFQANKIYQIPVVDENKKIVGLHTRDDLYTPGKKENTMIIMAGGKGARLLPHTETCPKPLLPVSGKPILQHIIEKAKAEGFSNFIISIGYLGEMIEDYFGNGLKFEVTISYIREDTPLGTAGAISLLEQIPDKPIVISNGDLITDVRYSELLDFHYLHKADATMGVRMYEWKHPFGIVKTKGVEITELAEKPVFRNYVNAGVYVLNPSVLNRLEKGVPCDMPDFFASLITDGMRSIVFPMHESWLDLGSEEEYMAANNPDSE
jgi:dTDP-glucose pyrophosphorylase/predicted transcriptional regulator